MTDEPERCGICHYYKSVTVTYGKCRHGAPVAGKGFATVPYDEWCGEFKNKKQVNI